MIKTWDIFDTLIARRCIFPKNIFQIVEQITKIEGFAQVRTLAESNASKRGNYNLDDIYEEFQELLDAPKTLCDDLKDLECDIEFEQSIPITENIRQVKSGDVLISDMYLPENFIRQLLNKAGLLVPVEILITSGGKSSGRIWQQFSEQNEFVFHTGDNMNGDIKNTRLAGFESTISISSNPNSVEQYLLQKDFDFGAYLREIRLRNPFPEEIKRLYWQLFTLNIGILILLVQQLDELQKKYGFEYLGFCGRDAYYLRLLYEKYKLERGEAPTPNDYLHYSRKLVRYCGDEMAKYFSDKINNHKALMIDLIGSGTHLNYLREKFNFNYSILICCHNGKESGKIYFNDVERPKDWLEWLQGETSTKANKLNYCILNFKSPSYFFPNPFIEPLNRATHNSPIRLKTLQVGEKILPKVTFSEINDIEYPDVFESCFREALNLNLVSPVQNSHDSVKELLWSLFKVLTSVSVPVPLQNQHQLSESLDISFIKFLNKSSASK